MRQAEDIAEEARQLGMDDRVDKELDRKADDKQEILQRIEDVLDMGKLMRMNFFDALYAVYNLSRSDEHEAMVNNWSAWIDEIRDEVCKGGD